MTKRLPKSQIAYIEISLFAHATEDIEKVMKAAYSIISDGLAPKITFNRSTARGDHGNPIVLLKTKVEDSEMVQTILEHISSQLSNLDKEKLLRDLDLHAENGNLFIRFDKQSACKGYMRLSSGDPIHVRVRFRNKKREEVVEICKDIGLLPRPNAP